VRREFKNLEEKSRVGRPGGIPSPHAYITSTTAEYVFPYSSVYLTIRPEHLSAMAPALAAPMSSSQGNGSPSQSPTSFKSTPTRSTTSAVKSGSTASDLFSTVEALQTGRGTVTLSGEDLTIGEVVATARYVTPISCPCKQTVV
jgi:hypothetical protein